MLATRYLGIYLGGPQAVRRDWSERISGSLTARIQQIVSAGVPPSCYGRATAQKTLVISKVVFYATNQMPVNFSPLLNAWTRELWDLYFSTRAGDEREAAGEARGRPPTLVRHATVVQDHGDGGARALDTPAFLDALRATWVRRLIDPAPQTWKNIIWAMLRSTYGPLAHGDLVVMSSLDFADLNGASGMPPLFVAAFQAWGRLDTPELEPAAMTYESLMRMPVLFSPGAFDLDHMPATPHHVAGRRQLRLTDASRSLLTRQRQHAQFLTGLGIGEVQHILPFARLHRLLNGDAAIAVREGAVDQLQLTPVRRRATTAALRSIMAALKGSHVEVLLRGAMPIQRDEWVTWRADDGATTVARAIESQSTLVSPFLVRLYALDRMHRLTPTGRYGRYDPGSSHPAPVRATVWLETAPPPRQRADGLDPAILSQTILAVRPPAKPIFRYAGPASLGAVNPTQWRVRGGATLRAAVSTSLAHAQNHALYAALVSRRFTTDNALPSAFAIGGRWRGLLTRGRAQQETHAVFSGARTQALPMRAAQTLYHWHVDTLAVRCHLPGESLCPLCRAQGHRAANTSRHRLEGCAFSAALIRCAMVAWRDRFPNETWTDALTNPPAFYEIVPGGGLPRDRTLSRAIALGLRPDGQRAEPEAFALLRGLLMDAIEVTARQTWNAQQAGLEPRTADLYHAVHCAYISVADGLQDAMTGGLAAAELLTQRMLAAGNQIQGPSPVQRWRERWSVILDGGDRQTLLPRHPWGRRQVNAQNHRRLAPRPDWAPPAATPAATLQAYIASAETGAWAVVIVRGGDGALDPTAHLVLDAAGPATPPLGREPLACASRGAQVAATAAIALIRERMQGADAVVLRAAAEHVTCIAGMSPLSLSETGDQLRREWRVIAAERPMYLAGWRHGSHAWWGDRALCLADQCHEAAWGPSRWDGGFPGFWDRFEARSQTARRTTARRVLRPSPTYSPGRVPRGRSTSPGSLTASMAARFLPRTRRA